MMQLLLGRSDYPNQVNNLIGFPYIFRGALDVRSKTINEEMKVAAAHAIVAWQKRMYQMKLLLQWVVKDLTTVRII